MAGDDGELPIFSSNNDDIIIDTLSWLPVTSPPIPLCMQLIDYQSLKKNVAGASSASSAIRSSRRDVEDEFPDETSLNDSSLVGSCNGLICLLNPPLDCCTGYYENLGLLLWNPSTRTARKLPDIDWFRYSPLYYGFGYDSTTHDYKVLLGGQNPKDYVGYLRTQSGFMEDCWRRVHGRLLEETSSRLRPRYKFMGERVLLKWSSTLG
ncbi:uncharacterized protein [Pyrus communis]|uniref:uncharacterized protein n=1 Tax=Pyrus communis TaxID=23211 RepID=UPI0035BFD56E